jgi:FkbM family methyltransferase
MSSDQSCVVTFSHDGEEFTFRGPSPNDHIIGLMRKSNGIYERHVLERVRDRLFNQVGAAVDAGAFIGTHSVYFARCCDLQPVIAFEANAHTFPLLQENLVANAVANVVTALNLALGAVNGTAVLRSWDARNRGTTQVDYATPGDVRVTTIDEEVPKMLAEHERVALIKIDVEGAELEVLEGAAQTVEAHRPVLCVEVHTCAQLRLFASFLEKHGYWIVDCLGASPTYIAEPGSAGRIRRGITEWIWVLRAALPPGRARGLLRRLALRLGIGPWRPASA